jgi:hypothetical protein
MKKTITVTVIAFLPVFGSYLPVLALNPCFFDFYPCYRPQVVFVDVFKLSPYVVTAFAVFLLSFFIGICRRAVSDVGCRSPPFQSGLLHFKNFRLEEKRMAYNNGRENRKWLIWKEAEDKILREHGVDEITIEQSRTDDRADFNSNRRFYH